MKRLVSSPGGEATPRDTSSATHSPLPSKTSQVRVDERTGEAAGSFLRGSSTTSSSRGGKAALTHQPRKNQAGAPRGTFTETLRGAILTRYLLALS
ncbi:hypothetical protein E2C01_098548 [Portunus trituberculatus]|uniref:Uncharacterized protein n=1 Tax=Portunus trituberculatus TaxID=210409 RepID=A0A5B7KD72_PORTR|nr:hypothetical protein [Portunus trituberculatus]